MFCMNSTWDEAYVWARVRYNIIEIGTFVPFYMATMSTQEYSTLSILNNFTEKTETIDKHVLILESEMNLNGRTRDTVEKGYRCFWVSVFVSSCMI